MKAHTSGPWNVAGCEIFSADNDKMIARVFSGTESNVLLSGAISARESDCNAALIAAAPDILAALKALDAIHPQTGNEPLLQELLGNAREAIARARGQ